MPVKLEKQNVIENYIFSTLKTINFSVLKAFNYVYELSHVATCAIFNECGF